MRTEGKSAAFSKSIWNDEEIIQMTNFIVRFVCQAIFVDLKTAITFIKWWELVR